MYRWCSHCNTKYKLGTQYCTNPKCHDKYGRPWETDVEFEPGDILKDKKRQKQFKVIKRLSKHTDAGMSAVYLVQRADTGKEHKRAVIKVTKAKAHLPVLRREVYHLQRLKHKNVIKLAYGANMVDPNDAILLDTQDGQKLYFIALEYLSGGSAKDKISSQKPLSVSEGALIAYKIARALDYIHKHDVIHLDVKPANILFDAGGRVVLADFGVARTQQELHDIPHNNKGSSVPGTPAYNAPEKCKESIITDKRADVFALGVSLYEMLIGTSPLHHRSTTNSGSKHSSSGTGSLRCVPVNELPKPRTINKKIPVETEQIILKAIHPNRDKRYQTAGTFAKDLLPFIKFKKQKPAKPSKTAKPQKRPQLRFIGAGLLLAAIIGSTLLWFQMSGSGKRAGEPVSTPNKNEVIVSTNSSIILENKNTPENLSMTATPTAIVTKPTSSFPAPTSTLVPSPTPRPTHTPTPTPTQVISPSPSPPKDTHISLWDASVAGDQIKFRWTWSGGCDIPDGYGFQVRFWADQPNAMPKGVLNTKEMSTDEFKSHCRNGTYELSISNISDSPGAKEAGKDIYRFKWDVVYVQLDPYKEITPSSRNKVVDFKAE